MKPIIATLPGLLATLATVSGCMSSLSGLGGSESLSCKAPEGVVCTSVSGVYTNATTIAANAAPQAAPAISAISSISAIPSIVSANALTLSKDKPAAPPSSVARSSPRVLRLWIAPWEDGDGDLHEESTVHVLVDNGRWLIDHVRAAPRSRMDAVAPPPSVSGDSAKATIESPARSETLPMPPGMPPALNALPR